MPPTHSKAIEQRKQHLSQLVKALEDAAISPEDPRYFPFHLAPGEPRGIDPVHLLRTAIEFSPSEASCQLFSGFRGSGKSTELRRLRAELVARGFPVVVVEGARVLNLHQPLEPADLLVSVAAGVELALQESGALSTTRPSLFGRLASFLTSTNVNLTQFSAGASVDALGAKIDIGKLVFEIATNPTFKARVQEALRGRLSTLAKDFQMFMADARSLLVGPQSDRCPVLLMDDLEKVRGTGPEQDIVQKGMEQIFWQFGWALHIPGWHAVWTAPPYLQLLNGAITNEYDGSVVLPMIRVWENDAARTPDPKGIAAMKTCLRKRGDVDSMVMKEALLDRLIIASSGHLRDLLQVMRNMVKALYMQKDPTVPFNEHQIERIVNDYTNISRRAIYEEDVSWLRTIAEKRDLSLPNEAMLTRASKLIDTAVVMTYRNGEDWFDISHPAQGIV